MTIVLFCPYRLDPGGLATMVLQLQQGLRKRGHRAIVLVAGDSDVPTLVGISPDVYGVNLRRMHTDRTPLKGFVSFWFHLPFTRRALDAFLRRELTEVVHVHFVNPQALYLALLPSRETWSLAATFHGSDGYSLARRSRLFRWLVDTAARRADAVTAVSADLASVVRRTLRGLRTPTRVILNGHPLSVETRPTSTPDGLRGDYVLAVGSLITRKGYDVLVRAVRVARDKGRALQTVVVGTGPEKHSLAALASDLGVDGLVRFVGEVPYEEVRAYYEHAKAFVHCPREEAFGLVLLEAMSCGTAVVATSVNGIPEIIRDGDTGVLVPPDDPEALAAALIRLDADDTFRLRLAEAGRQRAEVDFSWDRVLAEYETLYRELATGGIKSTAEPSP